MQVSQFLLSCAKAPTGANSKSVQPARPVRAAARRMNNPSEHEKSFIGRDGAAPGSRSRSGMRNLAREGYSSARRHDIAPRQLPNWSPESPHRLKLAGGETFTRWA